MTFIRACVLGYCVAIVAVKVTNLEKEMTMQNCIKMKVNKLCGFLSQIYVATKFKYGANIRFEEFVHI